MNFVFQNAFYCHVCHRSLCVISKEVRTWLKENSRKHVTAPSSHCGEHSRSQIPGWVYGVTAVKPKCGANDEYDQTNHDRCHPLVGRIVVPVYDGEDTADKESRAEQLKNKASLSEQYPAP